MPKLWDTGNSKGAEKKDCRYALQNVAEEYEDDDRNGQEPIRSARDFFHREC